jgi:hypothetical protein
MKLYQIVPYHELKPRRRYYVRLPGSTEYHVGYFCDYDVPDRQEVAVFRHVDRFPDQSAYKMYTVSYEYFDRRHVFKRCVYEEEQARVRRTFYERRVVNQIVSHLLGHAVVVY